MSKTPAAPEPAARAPVDPDTLIALFFMAWRGFAAEADEVLAREELGRVHHRVLYAVVRDPRISVGELASRLGVTRQALHRPLADLTRRQLVTVRASEHSGRERAVQVTARGARLEDRASGAQRDQLTRIFAERGVAAAVGWQEVMVALAMPVVSRSPSLTAQMVRAGLAPAG